MERPRVLFIGNAAHSDFSEARAVLRSTAQVWFVPSEEIAAAWLGANRVVDWIVLCQSRLGELSRQFALQLQPLARSARYVSLLGSWCEGELRTGLPWPDMPRCYWHEFPSWWCRTGLGATGFASAVVPGPVVVSAIDYETASALLDALAAEGLSSIWWPRYRVPPLATSIAAGVWVGGQLSGQEAVQLDEFCRRLRSEAAPAIALLDFPRRDRVESARRIGVAEVLGKPWSASDLSHTLRNLISSRHTEQSGRNLAICSA